jgi:peptidoglycan/LPS O-acetylase OafA/YrhL
MAFYLLLTALFLGGAHRRSGRYALIFGVAAVALGGLLRPGGLSFDVFTPGVVVAITDSVVLVGLALAVAARGWPRTAGAVAAAVTGLLLIVFNGGYAASWETFTIFALMFTGTLLFCAESGQVPWRRARLAVIVVFGLVLVAGLWHISPGGNAASIRVGFNSLEFAGLTFAVAMLCRNRKVPRFAAWLGLVSYSIYLIHPMLIEAYTSVPATRNENFVPMELGLVGAFVLALLVCSALTHRFIEAPMQRLGRRVARRLDVRFGEDLSRRRRLGHDGGYADRAGAPAVEGAGRA